jgi:glycerophosphoryl diester phosphodiesterase
VHDGVEIIAHRGYSARAPENTVAAMRLAIEAGADAIEFDVHTTADRVPVVIHDPTLRRTTDGSGRVADKSLAEIQSLDAGSWFSEEFANERVPTLEHALTLIAGRVDRVYAEVKGYRRDEDLVRMGELARTVMPGRTVFISMDWSALAVLRAHDPKTLVGYVVEKESRTQEAVRLAMGDTSAVLDFKASILLDDANLARRATTHGIDLAAWTVDDPREATKLLALGVRRITTNRVVELLAWKESL